MNNRTAESINRAWELNALAWRAARCRDLADNEAVKLVQDVVLGKQTLDPKEVNAEIEQYLKTIRVHEGCKGWVRVNGFAPYDYRGKVPAISESLCQCCAKPLTCSGPSGNHEYIELSAMQARSFGVFHGGRCYHVYRCVHCSHIHSVDTSD
jgi:hypothetical protein